MEKVRKAETDQGCGVFRKEELSLSQAAFVDGGSQKYIMMMSSSHSPPELMRVEEGSPFLFSGWPCLML